MKKGIEAKLFAEGGHEQTKRDTAELPQFAYRISMESGPDRYGAIGSLDALVDWRPRAIKLSYNFRTIEDNVRSFYDDHERSFNAKLANGGRDMRMFSLRDPEVVERRRQYMEALKKEKDELGKRIAESIPAVRYITKESVVERTEKNLDDDGGYSYRDYTQVYLSFEDARDALSSKGGVTLADPIRVYGGGAQGRDATKIRASEEYARAEQELDRLATDAFRDSVRRLKEREESPEIQEILARYRFLENELRICEGTISVSFPTFLTSQRLTAAERARAIVEYQEGPDAVKMAIEYNPERLYADILGGMGMKGTYAWYSAFGIDAEVPEGVIPFHKMIGGKKEMKTSDVRETMKPNSPTASNTAEELRRAQKALIAAEAEALAAQHAEKVAADHAANMERVRAEMGPEVKAQVMREIDACIAMVRIASSYPAKTPEQEKVQKSLSELTPPYGELKRVQEGMLGLEVRDRLALISNRVQMLVSRQKITQELPRLWGDIVKKTELYSGVDDLIARSRDAQAAIDLGLITGDDLARDVRETFLQSPWDTTPEEILAKRVAVLLE